MQRSTNGSPAVEQANAPAIEQTAQVASENVEAMQPNAELAAQQTEQALNQKAAAPMISSSAEHSSQCGRSLAN